MRAELVNLNHCAVPFLNRATVNLYWYCYTCFPGKGTLCPVSHVSEKKKLDNKEWSYQIVSVEEKVLTLRLISSASCPVGYYKLLIESYSEG